MIKDQFGQIVFSDEDLINLIMEGHAVENLGEMLVDQSVDLQSASELLTQVPRVKSYSDEDSNLSIEDFDRKNQSIWFMPEKYQQMDIAEHILNLCQTEAQLQRVGEELLLFQEKNLFDLLKYLKYLVDVMQDNNIIWGVGRGSSVASYVLYLLKVHRIDSLYYQLDPKEFLR